MKLELPPAADAAYFETSPAEVETTKEIEPGIIADYDADGHLVGIELLSVSKRARPPHLDKESAEQRRHEALADAFGQMPWEGALEAMRSDRTGDPHP